MPQKLNYYILVIVGMGASLLVSSYLLQTLFIEKNPTPFWNSFSGKMTELKQKTLLAQSSVFDYIQQISHSFESVQPAPTPTPMPTAPLQSDSFSFFDTLPAPTTPPLPTSIPTLVPSKTPSPTENIRPTTYVYPTSKVIPTISINNPTTFIRPTAKPTNKPLQPTTAPQPPAIDVGQKVVGDPLKQTWYGNGSLACYTTERFIQVYANALKPNSCYGNVKSAIDANIVSATLLGRSIQVHKKTLPAFQAVAKTLDQYKVDSSTYKFPSKTYKIKNVGAYVFRCNVNASTSGKNDVCDPGCKLSAHAFGIAVDINYEENCNGCTNFDMPKEISDTFELYGFRWGGHYPLLGSKIDPMHFEYMKDLCAGI